MKEIKDQISNWIGMTIVNAEFVDADDNDYGQPILALSLKQPPSMYSEESVHRDVALSADGEVLLDVSTYLQVPNRVDLDE